MKCAGTSTNHLTTDHFAVLDVLCCTLLLGFGKRGYPKIKKTPQLYPESLRKFQSFFKVAQIQSFLVVHYEHFCDEIVSICIETTSDTSIG